MIMSQENVSPLTVTRWVILTVSLTITITMAAPVQQRLEEAEIYLSQFGYLPPSASNSSNGGLLDSNARSKAIMEFQGFAGVNTTGELDRETMEFMSLPRCGVKDKVIFGSNARIKRYAALGEPWKTKALTYRIMNYPIKLSHTELDKEIRRAFNVWSEYTDLTFTQKYENPIDIKISFVKGKHGDCNPFDGPGNVLAHATLGADDGRVHFDAAEKWIFGDGYGVDVFEVAVHEFGHVLGLKHSDVRSAIMAVGYWGYNPDLRLDPDDIQGIQALYGKKTSNSGYNSPHPVEPQPTTTTIPNRIDNDEICRDPKIDTMFNTADGATYAFKGHYYYKLTENGIDVGYPKLISQGWPGLPGNIDAAFTDTRGKSYFFTGSQCYRYTDRRIDAGFPKNISSEFVGIPDNVDAALQLKSSTTYFYKGSKFWRFEPFKRPHVMKIYPKPLTIWKGHPNSIDAALQHANGSVYLFKGNGYYRFNTKTFSVVNPEYPLPTAHWWFGCKNDSNVFNTSVDADDGSAQYDSLHDLLK